MGTIDDRIDELGLVLPPEPVLPPGVVLPFDFVRVVGDRAVLSGHGPQSANGAVEIAGTVGQDLTVEEGHAAARLVALSMLGSLQRELGTLDRVAGWVKALGMVRCGPEFTDHPAVINGFSDLIIEIFGPEVGAHSRSAVGLISLPWGMPVEIEGEVLLC
ncbi:MAG: RidA family protein [Actinomycetota bacterium]